MVNKQCVGLEINLSNEISRVPPAGGRYGGNVSFWYGTATVAGIGILVLCFFYWCVHLSTFSIPLTE